MKRILKVIIGASITLYTVGCTPGEMIERVLDPETAVMKDIGADVIRYIEKEDYDGMKSLFSENTLSEIDDFEADMDYLIDFVDGEIIEWEIGSGHSLTQSTQGLKYLEIDNKYEIKTTKEHYVMYILNYETDDYDPENEGVYTIRIEKYEDMEKVNFSYPVIPGIYNPNREQ